MGFLKPLISRRMTLMRIVSHCRVRKISIQKGAGWLLSWLTAGARWTSPPTQIPSCHQCTQSQMSSLYPPRLISMSPQARRKRIRFICSGSRCRQTRLFICASFCFPSTTFNSSFFSPHRCAVSLKFLCFKRTFPPDCVPITGAPAAQIPSVVGSA